MGIKRMTLEEIIKIGKDNGWADSVDSFTCYRCSEWNTCQYAWDFYNTNGDCLENK